jgi:hypothetical protein
VIKAIILLLPSCWDCTPDFARLASGTYGLFANGPGRPKLMDSTPVQEDKNNASLHEKSFVPRGQICAIL